MTPEKPLTITEGYEFMGGTVHLDGQFYKTCRFVGVDLVYSGTAPFGHAHCEFVDSRVRLDAKASELFYYIARSLGDADLLVLAAAHRMASPPLAN